MTPVSQAEFNGDSEYKAITGSDTFHPLTIPQKICVDGRIPRDAIKEPLSFPIRYLSIMVDDDVPATFYRHSAPGGTSNFRAKRPTSLKRATNTKRAYVCIADNFTAQAGKHVVIS